MIDTAATPADLHERQRQSDIVRGVLERRIDEPGALLPILHEVQDMLGYVPRHVVPEIASALNLSRAEVHGVVTYYHHFRSAPAAPHLVQICRAESCQSMGADALMAHAELQLGCPSGHGTSADGSFTLEPTYCLGLCSSSPAMTFDNEVHARVTPSAFDRLVAQARSVS